MKKTYMSSLDVRATVQEMNSQLIGLRLLNIYDIPPKMFVFKFGQADNKKSVLLENGIRMHISTLMREKPKVPSQFTLKLRKHVRAWRLDSVRQLTHNRTIDMCFGTAGSAGCFHIIIELFGQGNVILTDHAYAVIVLLRTPKGFDLNLKVREVYPPALGETAAAPQLSGTGESRKSEETAESTEAESEVERLRAEWMTIFSRNEGTESLRSTLSGVCHFGIDLSDHIMTASKVRNVKIQELKVTAEELFDQMKDAMIDALRIPKQSLAPGGYLFLTSKASAKAALGVGATTASSSPSTEANGEAVREVSEATVYSSYTSVILAQHEQLSNTTRTFRDSFGQVCEEYYLPTEMERISQHKKKKDKALSKRDKFEMDHQRRVTALERDEEHHRAVGEMIIANAEKVDEAIGLINGAIAAGIQWGALKDLLRRRHAEGHPVAYIIHGLSLERNSISVLLERELYDDENDADVEPLVVEVELDKTAHANASAYFSKAKANKEKLSRTLAATEKAAQGADRKAHVQASKQTYKRILQDRQRNWWEKYNWFRTSAGDLVLQGKDIQSTEILIRRVIRVGDLFVHCDEEKSLPCILRPLHAVWTTTTTADGPASIEASKEGRQPVSMTSLLEAASWCVSLSVAWERKKSVGAWWVYGSQITGGTASGCYLYEGAKHHVMPQPLVLGCGLLFCVSRDIRAGVDADDDLEAALPSELPGRLLGDLKLKEAGIDYVAADTAETLPELPSPAAVRAEQLGANKLASVRPTTAAVPGAGHSKKVTPAPTKHRNSRANKALKEVAEASDAGKGAENRPLSKYQLKKLKKIKSKYGDQDEEDRALGALLVGNQLAKVQRRQLQEEAERREAEVKEARKQRKEERRRQMQQGKLRVRVLGDEDRDSVNEEDLSEWSLDDDDDGTDEKTHQEEEDNEGLVKVAAAHDEQSDGEDASEEGEMENITTHKSQKQQQPSTPAESAAVYDAELKQAIVSYTSRPTATDTVRHILSVCAPFQTVETYAYREELCVGNVKKGQTAEAILRHFTEIASGATSAPKLSAIRKTGGREGGKSTAPPSSTASTARASAADPARVPVKNESLQQALAVINSTHLIDQLRGNVKPCRLRIPKG